MLITFEGIDVFYKSAFADYIENSRYSKLFQIYRETGIVNGNQFKAILRNEKKIIILERCPHFVAPLVEDKKSIDVIDVPKPDITFIFDISVEEYLKQKKTLKDKLSYDKRELENIRAYYLAAAKRHKDFIILDRKLNKDEMLEIIVKKIADKIPNFYIVDEEKADLLVQMMYEDYFSNPSIIEIKSNLIENQLPKGVVYRSKEHINFLFFTALNDHGVKSKQMYERAKIIYLNQPEFYNPFFIEKMDLEDLEKKVARPLGARYPKTLAKYWRSAATLLIEKYDGKVINLVNSENEGQKLLKKILEFKGIGPKIGAMILRAIVTLDLNKKLSGVENVLLPVDVHDTRILMRTGVLTTIKDESFYVEFVEIAQNVIKEACIRNHLNWIIVDKSLWLTGSGGLLDLLVLRMKNKIPS